MISIASQRSTGLRQNNSKAWSNSGISASLFEKIGYAYNYYEQGDISTTKETINAFINELKALSGKKLDSASAEMLIKFAEEIMAAL